MVNRQGLYFIDIFVRQHRGTRLLTSSFLYLSSLDSLKRSYQMPEFPCCSENGFLTLFFLFSKISSSLVHHFHFGLLIPTPVSHPITSVPKDYISSKPLTVLYVKVIPSLIHLTLPPFTVSSISEFYNICVPRLT